MIFLSLLLAGCYDDADLESRSVCTAIAADYSQTDGFTIYLSFPKNDKDEKPSRIVKTATGKTISEAISSIDASSSKTIYFGQAKAAIAGVGLIENYQAFTELTSYLSHNVQIDKNIYIAASNNVKELMDAEPAEDMTTGFYISGFYEGAKNEKTYVNSENLLMLLKDNAEKTSTLIPLISIKNEQPAFEGTVVLKDGAFKGILEDDEAYGCMWLQTTGFNGTITVDESTFAEVLEKSTEYKFYEENNDLKMNIAISADANMWNYSREQAAEKGAEYLDKFKQKIISQSNNALTQLAKMDCLPSDIINGLKNRHPDLYDRYKAPKAENISISVNFSLNFV